MGISDGLFTVLLWLLGPVSAFSGGVLVVYWLLREIRHGDYRAKYAGGDVVAALEGVVPQDAIQRELRERDAISEQERERLRTEGRQ